MATRAKKPAPARKGKRPPPGSLTGDWYWEQDSAFRFTKVDVHAAGPADQKLARRILGKRRWDSGIEVEGGWEAHRALLEAHVPFRDVLMWRELEDGSRRYLSVTGEPVFDARGRFKGYRGVGRDISRQKRGEQILRLQHVVTQRLAELTDAAQGAEACLKAICETEGWDCGEFWRVDEGGLLRRFVHWVMPGAAAGEAYAAASGQSAFRPGEGLAGHVLQTGEPLWIPDAANDPRAARKFLAEQTGLHAALLFPVPGEGRIAGVLGFACRKIRPPDEALIQALGAVCTQLGLFLRRAGAEARLRESEKRFRHTFELAGVGVAHIGLDRRFMRVNRQFCEILGYAEHELVGITGRDISHPDDRDHMNMQRPRLHSGEINAIRGEKRYLRKDGSVVWVAYTLAVERDAAGRPQYEIAVYDDISARRAMEDALRDSEARFRQVVDSANEGIVVYDRDHNIVTANAAAARIIGVPMHAMIGRPGIASLVPCVREDGAPVRADDRPTRRTVRRGEPLSGIIMGLLRPGGEITWLSLNTGLLRRPGEEEYYGIVSTFSDITALKRGEQLLRLEHGVTRSLAAASEMAQGLKGALQAICETERWEIGRFLRVDAAAGVLRQTQAWSVSNPDIERYLQASRDMVYAPGTGLVGRVWQSGEPLWVPDITRDERVARTALAQATGMRGAFAAAVVSEGTVIGVCIFHSREIREPDARLLQAIGVICGQVGQFLRRLQAEESLRKSEARFRSLTEMSSDFFWETDAEHRFIEMVHGRGYPERLGRVIGHAAWDLPSIHPDAAGWAALRAAMDAHRPVRDFEFGRPWSSGAVRYFMVNGDPHFDSDGSFLGYRGVGRDITDVALARERIASLAYHDALTGLDNRISFAPALEKAVERTRRRGTRLAGLFLDLDGFKEINDRYGNDAGDRLLVAVAQRLRTTLRSGDPVARLGGDEFFVLLEDLGDVGPAERVAGKLLASLEQPYTIGVAEEVSISASIGISVFPDDAADAATLMKHADTAMYAAKQAGKNAYRFFSERPAANDPRSSGAERAG